MSTRWLLSILQGAAPAKGRQAFCPGLRKKAAGVVHARKSPHDPGSKISQQPEDPAYADEH
jgi:hypothetical protein